jgi:shikimate kinase
MLGLMGTGKSVVGAAVARHLALPFSDNDAAIAEATGGLTARQIRERHGVGVLHDLEARHLLAASQAPSSTVICAAASTIEDASCRTALEQPGIVTIWLRATAETLASRFDNEDHRPVFGPDPVAFFRSQIVTRYPRFLELGGAVVDVDSLGIAEVVQRVIETVDRQLAGEPRARQTRTVRLELEPSPTPEPPHEWAGTEEEP